MKHHNINKMFIETINIDDTPTPPKPKALHSASQHSTDQPTIHEEKTLFQNEFNDDRCFNCNRKGQLYCCDQCFRAFHKHCISTKPFSKVWSCEYCTSRELCLQCSAPLKYHSFEQMQPSKHMHTCTICFRSIHQACSNVPAQLMRTQSHFFSDVNNFVCRLCIKQFGFKTVITCQRVGSKQGEKIYYFVSVNTLSPIHCGWFEESVLRGVPRCKQSNEIRETEVFQVQKIDRIIKMKVPPSQRSTAYDRVLSQILIEGIPKSHYGRQQNTYFQVVWEGKDLTSATWQDQNVIKIHNANNPHCKILTKFILYQKLQVAFKQKKALTSLYALFDKFIPNVPITSHLPFSEHFHANFTNKKHLICKPNSKDANPLTDFICLYLQRTYASNLTLPPTLLICNASVRSKWERRIKETCPQLSILVCKGTEANISEMREKQMLYQGTHQTKFQLMVIPSQRWVKQRKFLRTREMEIHTLIMDNLVNDNIIEDELVKESIKLSKRISLVNNSMSVQKIIDHKNNHISEGEQQVFVYDFSINKVLNGKMKQVKQTTTLKELQQLGRSDENSFERNVRWNELQRIVFLRYVLAFGLNYDPERQFQKLTAFDKGTFSQTPQEREATNQYTRKFMAALLDYKNVLPRQPYLRFYFADFPAASIYKRICRLARLKATLEQFKINCMDFPFHKPMKVFAENSVVQISEWRSQHDYLLGAVMIEKGFGKWIEIAQFKYWQKWMSPCHIQSLTSRNLNNINFGEFVKLIIKGSSAKEARIEQILKERGEYLLTLND